MDRLIDRRGPGTYETRNRRADWSQPFLSVIDTIQHAIFSVVGTRFCKRFSNRFCKHFWAECGGIHGFAYFLYSGFIWDIGNLVFSPNLLSALKPSIYYLLASPAHPSWKFRGAKALEDLLKY